MAVAWLLMASASAHADCHSDGDDVGSGYTHAGAGSQFMSWNRLTRQVQVQSNAGSGMSTSVCLDAIVDWMTVEGHYDNRTARNCDPGSSRSALRTEPSNWAGRTITGLQRAVGCRYVQVEPPEYQNCEYLPPSADGCEIGAAHYWYTPGHAVWLRRENGEIEYNDGGNEASPSS